MPFTVSRSIARAATLAAFVAFVGIAEQAVGQMESGWVARVAPSRPQMQTLWQPPALPLSERDVIDIAGRLGLTREQTLAFESLLPEYLQQACELRRGAIKSIAADGVIDWTSRSEGWPKQSIQRSAEARLAYERALAALDSSLFDRLQVLLTTEQQARLPSERLRRDRQRLFTDDLMISMCGEGPLLADLRALTEPLELPADQRDAVRALVDNYEPQATARLRAVFEASAKEGIKFAEAMEAQSQDGQPQTQVTQPHAGADAARDGRRACPLTDATG